MHSLIFSWCLDRTTRPAHAGRAHCPSWWDRSFGRLPTVSSVSVTVPPESPAPGTGPDTDGGRFSAAVAAVSAAFGDPTRRDIFLHVRAKPGLTATEVGFAFSLHPNVARHHLQRLVDGGYLRVETGRKAPGAGRPSKQFF